MPAMVKKRLQKSASPRVRLRDVAAQAGCSTASVSRVLNAPISVKASIRARVLGAMKELGYMPNGAARALRSQRSHTMGILIPTLNHAIYARLVEALQKKLSERGYSLLVATFEYDLENEVEQAHLLLEHGSEGIVLIGQLHDPALHELLERSQIPSVNTYAFAASSSRPCVGFDNRQAMAQITQFLIGLGHRAFSVISAITAGNDRAAERVAGVRETLERHGLALPGHAVYERPYSIANGREGLRYLASLSPPPTAIICGNDILAMGALIESRTLEIHVPERLSIAGFDNLEFAPYLDPPLTTMEVPAAEMGERAAEFLLARIAEKPVAELIYLEPRLIVRQSTGPAPR
jgi:LacI family transcriptional regulator